MKTAMAVVAVAGFAAAASADVLFSETFEGSNQFTGSTAEFSDGFGDYWFQTGGSLGFGSFIEYNGADGNFFAGMDLDGEGASIPLTQTYNTIDITNYENLSLSVDLAEDDDGANQDYDEPDFVSFEYSLDGGVSWNEIFRVAGENFTSSSGPFNGNPAVNGVEVTSTFATFSFDLTGVTGSSMDLRSVWFLNSGDEDLAIDNVTVSGTLIPTPATAGLLGLDGLVAARRRRA